MKKKIALIMTVCMLSVIPTGCGSNATESDNEDKKVSSEQTFEANPETDFTWYENEESNALIPKGGIVITGYVGTDTDVVIPKSIDGKAVVAIDECAFSPYTKYQIEGPGEYYNFFEAVLGLEDITSTHSFFFDEDIDTYMKNHDKKSKITSIQIPDSVKYIEQYAFFFCDSLVEIHTYGDNKDAIYVSYSAFEYCCDLKVIDFPIGLNENYYEFNLLYAFNFCSSLEEIAFVGIGGIELSLESVLEFSNPKKIVVTGDVISIDGGVAVSGACDGLVSYDGQALKDCEIYIPETVTELNLGLFINEDGEYVEDMINDKATDYRFEDVVTINPNVTIIAPTGSYAEEFAKEHGIPYKNE